MAVGPCRGSLPSKTTLCLLQDFAEVRRLLLAVLPPASAAWHFSACMLGSGTQKSESGVCRGCRCLQHLNLDSTGRETRARAPCLCNNPLRCL